jgi:8-oxo-dGTP pyrophosphatase MutT (NUDIX family)
MPHFARQPSVTGWKAGVSTEMPHIHEKVDFTVEVFIVYNNKVLLRKHDKYKMWLSVGGHIELDEDPNQAAVREVKEEVGLDVELFHNSSIPMESRDHYKELIPPVFMNRHRINEKHEHLTMSYFARAKTDKLILCDDEVTEECRWFTSEDLDNKKFDVKPHIREYAKAALKALKNNIFS